jgi:hypothetical protein
MVGFGQQRRAARTSAQIANATAEQFGLSRQELDNALADGLAQFGIRGQGAIDTLLAGLDSTDAARRAEAEDLLSQLMMVQQVTGQTPEMWWQQRQMYPETGVAPPDYSTPRSYGR